MIHRRLEPEVISQAVEPEHEAHDDAEREIEQRAASEDSPWLAVPIWSATIARVKTTIGVTMPSLSPLSTFSARPWRSGIRSWLMTCS